MLKSVSTAVSSAVTSSSPQACNRSVIAKVGGKSDVRTHEPSIIDASVLDGSMGEVRMKGIFQGGSRGFLVLA